MVIKTISMSINRIIVIVILLTSVVFCTLCPVKQANAVDNSFSVAMTVFLPIVITKVRDLTVDPIQSLPEEQGIYIQPADPQAAYFTMTGQPNAFFNATLAFQTVTLSNGVGGTIMVDDFEILTHTPAAFDSKGKSYAYVGATLTVGVNQAAGFYTGSNSLSISYY